MLINFQDIILGLDQTIWQFSYLTSNEIKKIFNLPIKFRNEIQSSTYTGEYLNLLSHFWLIGLKYGEKYDYSCRTELKTHIQKKYPNLIIKEYDSLNLKEACIMAGLGQRAKNTLIYNSIFHFNYHIVLISLDAQVINLPQRNLANFNLLQSCKNCNKCLNSCPVNAIHYDENTQQSWIDLYSCSNFCDFGNHPSIKSRKWTCLKDLYPFHVIYEIDSIHKCVDTIGQHINEYQQGSEMDICRECCNQICCSNIS